MKFWRIYINKPAIGFTTYVNFKSKKKADEWYEEHLKEVDDYYRISKPVKIEPEFED